MRRLTQDLWDAIFVAAVGGALLVLVALVGWRMLPLVSA
jgi:hypothetical protein